MVQMFAAALETENRPYATILVGGGEHFIGFSGYAKRNLFEYDPGTDMWYVFVASRRTLLQTIVERIEEYGRDISLKNLVSLEIQRMLFFKGCELTSGTVVSEMLCVSSQRDRHSIQPVCKGAL